MADIAEAGRRFRLEVGRLSHPADVPRRVRRGAFLVVGRFGQSPVLVTPPKKDFKYAYSKSGAKLVLLGEERFWKPRGRNGSRSLHKCLPVAVLQWHSSREGGQRKNRMGPFPLYLPQISTPDLSRVCRSLDPPVGVGESLLRKNPITQPSDLWHINGSASSIAGGKTANPTTRSCT